MMHRLVFWRCACLATLILGFARNLVAQEICGLQEAHFDTIFANGFDDDLGGLGPPVGAVLPPTTGVTPVVTITWPTPGAVLPGGRVQIAGTVTGPVNTGVSADGLVGFVHNGTFLTPEITLESAATSLSIQATTMDGLTASDSVTFTVGPAASARLRADASLGYAPLPVQYTLTTSSSIAVQSVDIDFDTDGTVDYNASSTADLPMFTYEQPGVHTATATLSLDDSSQIVLTHRIMVLDFAEQRATICSVYAHLRQRMAAEDVTGAEQALSSEFAARLLPLLNALGQDLPTVAAKLGTMANGMIGLNFANIITVREVGGDLHGHPVRFVRDAQGVWRITSM